MRPFAALDTSTDHLAIAVGDLDRPGAVLAAADFASPRAANTAVLPALERLLADAGVAVAELAAVVCGRGPGSFTGVRIGVATAKGLAHGLGIPLVGVGTLDAVASRVAEAGLLGVVGDAMRGEVYPALFRVGAGGAERLTADRVTRPEVIAAEWSALDEPVTLAGWGLTKHRAVIAAVLGPAARMADERLWVPDGGSLVAAAWHDAGPGSLAHLATLDPADPWAQSHPAALLPVYTRLSDAEEAERRCSSDTGVVPAGGVLGAEGGAAQ